MGVWKEIKQRRITQIVVTYLATGWMALAVVDQFVDREVLPVVVYSVSLTLYAFGFFAALVIGWYHGEKGVQKAPLVEIVALAVLALGGLGVSVQIVRGTLAEAQLAASRADTGVDMRRIAVRYFEDVTGGQLADVADGITESLIDRLSEVRSLDVISRNGVLPYRDAALRADSVARALDVGTLIEGSVDQRGGQLRITTRLVDGLSGADIERTSIDIPAGEFLAARDSVAEGVSRLLRARLGEEVRLRELRAGTASPQAWALAQRATRLIDEAEDHFEAGGDIESSRAALQQADSLLAQAADIDARWVRPLDVRAHTAYRRAWFAASAGDVASALRHVEEGLEYAERALALDPTDASALEQRGTLKLFRAAALAPSREEMASLMTEAEADLQAAVRQNSSLASAHAMLSFLYTGAGDNVQSVISAQRALEEDAYLRGADRIYDRLVYAQYELEQLGEAARWCDEGYRRFPGNYRFTECQLWLLAAPRREADVDAAWALLARLDSLAPESLRAFKRGVGQIMVAGVLRKASLPDSAEAVLARVDHGEAVDPQRQLRVYEAGIRASTGDVDGALAALRRWVAATPGGTLGPTGELNWWWRELRVHPDFQQFVSRD